MEIKIPMLKSLKEKNQQRLEAIEKNQKESNKFQENLCSLEKMARNITNHFQENISIFKGHNYLEFSSISKKQSRKFVFEVSDQLVLDNFFLFLDSLCEELIEKNEREASEKELLNFAIEVSLNCFNSKD